MFNISAVDDKASLALCRAATEASRSLGGNRVSLKMREPGVLNQVLDFSFDHSVHKHAIEGTMIIDDDLRDKSGCQWLNRVRAGAISRR